MIAVPTAFVLGLIGGLARRGGRATGSIAASTGRGERTVRFGRFLVWAGIYCARHRRPRARLLRAAPRKRRSRALTDRRRVCAIIAPVFEIGNSLREARLRRQIEFNQAELATKIRVKYLRALEDERFEQLPSQTYVKGFLRTYAEYLGLDGQLYVDEYNSRFVAGEDAGSPGRAARRCARAAQPPARDGIVLLVAVAIVAIVTLVVVGAWQTSGSGGKKAPATKTHAARTRSTPAAAARLPADRGGRRQLVRRGAPNGPDRAAALPGHDRARAGPSRSRASTSGSTSARPRTS